MKEYIGTLIWTMLFVVVIEMIFPESQMRKYLKLMLGFMVVYAILFPLISNNWFPVAAYANKIEEYGTGMYSNEAYEAEVKLQQEKNETIYRGYMEERMASTIEQEVGIEVLSLKYTSGQEGQNLEIMVAQKEEEKKIQIGKIQIGDKSENNKPVEQRLKNEIKSCLKNFYNLDQVNIYITVQGN
jgi:stage III sporulation protein AF